MGGAAGASRCARRRSWSQPRMAAYSAGEQGRVRGLPRHHAAGRGHLDRRGVPRRRRAAADRGHAHRDRRRGCASDGRAAEVGLPITVGVARTKFLAKVASAVAKPDGLLVVAARARARVPAPAAGRAAVGRRAGHPREAARARASARSARSPRLGRGGAGVDARRRRGGRHLHALAHNRDPRPVRPAGAARSIGSQQALGSRSPQSDGRARRGRSSASSTGSPGGCAAADRVGRTVVLRLRFDDFTRATRSHTLAPTPPRTRPPCSRPPCARLLAGRHAA